MKESHTRGVQEISAKRWKEQISNALLCGRAIDGVPYHGTSKRGKMHADLMRSPRVQTRLHQCVAAHTE